MKPIQTIVTAAALLAIIFVGRPAATAATADVAEDALRATVRVTDGNHSGTAFLVDVERPLPQGSHHLLVTAAHVFEEMPGDTFTAVFRTGDVDHGYQRKEVHLPLREKGRPLWSRHPDMDVAAVPIAIPADVDVKPFPYRQIAGAEVAERGDLRVGQDVFVPCFPSQLESNPAGWPVLRKGSIATYPLRPLARARTVLVDYSHFGGDSGAPVVATIHGEPVVAAVVIAMERQSDRTVSPFEERVVHTPLGLAIAVQAPFVREIVDRLYAAQ